MMSQTEAVMYYDLFLRWIDDYYTLTIEDQTFYLLLFDPKLKRWFEYKDGYYHELEIQIINQIYLNCMQFYNIPTTTPKMNHCIKYLETICLLTEPWADNSPKVDCVKNGIVDIKTKRLIAHTPEIKFKYQIARNFIEDVNPVIPPLFNECLNAIPDKRDRDNYLKFWLAVTHKVHDYEVFLMCYGVKWGGKSSNLNIFSNMYGNQALGKKPLHLIGKRFGLSNLYDKRINIHADMPIVDLDPFTISQLKSLTGEDGGIDIEIKGVTAFTHDVALFLAFGINQLMGFKSDAEKEIDSVMRRVVLVEFPNIQKVNPAFKKKVQDPTFLDELYSWFIITSPLPLFDPEEQDEWVQTNKKKWLLNSNPVLRILMDYYQYDKGQSVRAYDVVAKVREELENDGSLVPKNLKTQITNAFSTMNIYTNGRRGGSAAYENVSEIGANGIPKIDLDFLLKEKDDNE